MAQWSREHERLVSTERERVGINTVKIGLCSIPSSAGQLTLSLGPELI